MKLIDVIKEYPETKAVTQSNDSYVVEFENGLICYIEKIMNTQYRIFGSMKLKAEQQLIGNFAALYNLGTGVLELKAYDQAVGFEIIVPSCGNDQSKIYNLLEEATNLKNEWLYYLDVADDLIVHSIVYADKEILKPYLKEKPQAILW